MGKLDGKVALITGAARGQGRSHAVRMAAEGADVIALDICEDIATVPYELARPEDLEETARQVVGQGRRCVAEVADVRDLEQLEAAIGKGTGELGRLDLIVANAGICSYDVAQELSVQAWQDVVDVNLTGVWKTCRVAIPHLLGQGEGGSIVIVSSVAGLHPVAGAAHYVTTKTGLIGLTRALALELGPNRIRVNSIHPTQVDTPMVMNEATIGMFASEGVPATRETMFELSQATHVIPEPWLESNDISDAVIFLTSDDSKFITGVGLPIDLGKDLQF